MSLLYQIYLNQFVLFTLVLVRVSGLIMTAPIFGGTEVPMRVRGLLAFTLSVLVMPLQWGRTAPEAGNLVNYAVLVVTELLVGVTLGFGVMLLVSGVQVTGQIISQLGGMQLADVYNPGLDNNVPIFSQFFYYVTLAVFVIIGGHRKVMEALLDTFAWLPPGQGVSDSVVDTLVSLLAQSFELGIRAAAPAMVALLLATVVMGLVSRTLPQLNVMVMGFGINSFVSLGTLSVSLGAAAWLFQEQLDPMLQSLLETLRGVKTG